MSERIFKVIAPAAVLRSADGQERYVYRGALVAAEGLSNGEHLLANGLLSEYEAQAQSGGRPSKQWNVDAIVAWAVEHNIELPEQSNKAEKLQVIADALAAADGQTESAE